MSDFHQHGLVPTLHRIGQSDPDAMDRRLAEFARDRPAAILIPCHGRDLGTPALQGILDALRTLRFPAAIVFAVNGVPGEAAEELRAQLARFPCQTRILHCDTPELRAVLSAQTLPGLVAPPPGKGLNLWLAQGLATGPLGAEVLVAHDSDILSYTPDLPLRLAFPLLHPECGYRFAKGFYHRATDRLYGRVTRLFFLPLLDALLRLVGHRPLLDFLAGFRYPLAGECALDRQTAHRLAGGTGYALETIQLCEIHRNLDPAETCQVAVGPNYEHRHHPASHDAGPGLVGMVAEIARALLAELRTEGLGPEALDLAALRSGYRQAGEAFARRYAHVALLNGMEPVAAEERDLVARFAAALPDADSPAPVPLPSWNLVDRHDPALRARLLDAASQKG